MKRLAFLAMGLMVTGCASEEAADPGESEEVAMSEEAAPMDPSTWASAEDVAGSYTLAYADGTEGTLTLMADGTSQGVIGGEEFTASFTVPKPGKLCYSDLSNEDLTVPPQCWVNSPANDDGSWGFTGDDGTTGTAKRAE